MDYLNPVATGFVPENNIKEYYDDSTFDLPEDLNGSEGHARDESGLSYQPSKVMRPGDDSGPPSAAGTPAPTGRRVGRKLDTKEPESKRRAQNRAAQRAFRERKEKHLKELETRVSELEHESRGWQNTSIALRSQLTALESELSKYRGDGKVSDLVKPGQGTGFTFSFPMQNSGPLTPSSDRTDVRSINGANTPGSLLGQPQPRQQAQQPRPRPVEQSAFGPSYVASPFGGNGSVQGESDASEPNTVGSTSATDVSPEADEFCDQLNLACPTRFRNDSQPFETAEPAKLDQPPKLTPTSDSSDTSPASLNDTKPVNFSFGYREPSRNDDDLFDIPDLINSEYSLFDPLEDLMGWPAAPAGSSTGRNGEQLAGPATRVPESLLAPSPPALDQIPGQKQPRAPAMARSYDPIAAANAVSGGDGSGDDIVPASKARLISCSEVWDRICAHPRFGELDISGMCSELRSKAKCSDTGVVLAESELDNILGAYK